MLSNSFLDKVSSFLSSLFNNRETNEKIYDPSSDDFILVNGKQISIKNNNSDINIIFPEFTVEKEYAENDSQLYKQNTSYAKSTEETKKTEKPFNFPSINLINNAVFPIFYISFALSFLIFLFLYEKSSVKSRDNYIQIGNSKLFVFNFFKLQNISHFIFHTFTFYTAIFGLCIVYIAFQSVYAKNSVLPAKSKFSNLYFYVVFGFGFLSNLLKLVSGLIIFIEFPHAKAEKKLQQKAKFSASIHEIVFHVEVYFTIAYGVLLFHYLKYFENFVENANRRKIENTETVSNIDKESLIVVINKENINNISSEESSLRLNSNTNNSNNTNINANNNLTFEEDEVKENLITNSADATEKIHLTLESKWLKFLVILYLFLMLLSLHLLKIRENYFIGKGELERNSYGMLKKRAVDSASVNYQYLVAFLPYGIYLLNSIFYFLNYELLKNSQVKLFIGENQENKQRQI